MAFNPAQYGIRKAYKNQAGAPVTKGAPSPNVKTTTPTVEELRKFDTSPAGMGNRAGMNVTMPNANNQTLVSGIGAVQAMPYSQPIGAPPTKMPIPYGAMPPRTFSQAYSSDGGAAPVPAPAPTPQAPPAPQIPPQAPVPTAPPVSGAIDKVMPLNPENVNQQPYSATPPASTPTDGQPDSFKEINDIYAKQLELTRKALELQKQNVNYDPQRNQASYDAAKSGQALNEQMAQQGNYFGGKNVTGQVAINTARQGALTSYNLAEKKDLAAIDAAIAEAVGMNELEKARSLLTERQRLEQQGREDAQIKFEQDMATKNYELNKTNADRSWSAQEASITGKYLDSATKSILNSMTPEERAELTSKYGNDFQAAINGLAENDPLRAKLTALRKQKIYDNPDLASKYGLEGVVATADQKNYMQEQADKKASDAARAAAEVEKAKYDYMKSMAEQLGYVFDPITGDIMRDADGNPVQSLSGQKTTADIGYTNAMADRARTDAMKNGVSSSGLDAIGKEAMDAINKGLFGDMYFSLTPQVDPVTKATTYIKTPITPEDQTAVYNRFSDWAWNKAQKAATDDEQRLSIFDFLLSQWTGNRPTNTVPQAPVAFPSGRPTIN